MHLTSKLLLTVFITLLFASCKKGEEDPAISFRTRKNRLTGEWRMTKGRASYTAGNYNENYTCDGTKVTVNVTSSGYPVIYTGSYILSLTINKNGSFTMNEVLANKVLNAEGDWNFNAGVGESKKKEEVIFAITKVNSSFTFGWHLFNRSSTHFVYKIVQLRNKEIIIKSSGKYYSNDKGEYVDYSTEYTFIQ